MLNWAVIQNDSTTELHADKHTLRDVSIAPPMIISLSQSWRAANENKKFKIEAGWRGVPRPAWEADERVAFFRVSLD